MACGLGVRFDVIDMLMMRRTADISGSRLGLVQIECAARILPSFPFSKLSMFPKLSVKCGLGDGWWTQTVTSH